MHLVADKDVCIAAGQCYLALPTVFDLDDEDGTVALLTEDPAADQEADVRAAVGLCPSGAIRIVD